jgi:proteic killer suppression protein
MIRNFKSKTAQDIFDGINSTKARKISPELHDKIIRLFDQINVIKDVEELRIPPSNHLEKLIGDRKGFWSLRINKQWRIIFRWENSIASDVDIVDYH